MSLSKVSIVVPCYNKKDYIAEMFDSVLAQIYDNIELILVDDGSTDGTSDIITAYIPKFLYRGFEVVTIHQRNAGLTAAVRSGLMRVTGEYICMPDCDDILMPDYISFMAGYLTEHIECEAVRTVADKHSFNSVIFSCNYLSSVLLGRSSIAVWTMMFRITLIDRIKLIDNIDPKCHFTQEPGVTLPVGYFAKNFTYINKALYIYRVTPGMLSRMMTDKIYAKNDLETRHSEILRIISKYNIPDVYKTYAEILYNKIAFMRKLITKVEYNNRLLDIAHKLGITVNEHSENIYLELTNTILGITQTVKDEYLNITSGRIIFYGVLGKKYAQYAPLLDDAGMKPDIMFDKKQGEDLVTKPGDVIVVFPAAQEIFDEVCILHPAAKCVQINDIFDYTIDSLNKE